MVSVGFGRFCATLAACVLGMGLSTGNLCAQGKGIAICKESTSHPDGSAKVFEFTMINKKGAVTDYFTPGGQKVSLTQFQPQISVAYPDLTTMSITSPDQLGPIVNGLRAYNDLVKRYPLSARFLKPYIQASTEMVRRINGGEIIFNGGWMTRSEYETMNKREDDLANKFNEQSREKKRASEELALRLDLETRRRKR
jgi:hypothetical protein